MALYGMYGEHTQAACPLYNKEIRQDLVNRGPMLEKTAEKMGVKILHQYHSALEHRFLWVVDADNVHSIQGFAAIGTFNTIKIVPLITFQDVVERCKQIEEGSYFPNM